ncbi:putative beta-D-xylosidase 7 [Iris pallida]|uniref:Beta-D-xylosidase 7 n=1 Tax=Iris pallida TaxID=29817 RepID=A0AAX6I2C1_IRIPA|nr:putative beta-D-xylosidase 7 [Iris pallida]
METHRALPLLLLFLTASFLPPPAHSGGPPYSCDSSNRNYGFCDASLPVDRRVDDLISRLSLEEKVSQLGDEAPPISRLGIPGYKWWSESLHGVSNSGRGIHFDGPIRSATSFPQVLLTAASFNPQLWYRIGQAIGTEARAIYNAGQAEGLTFWSPNINIFRDPRWGRGQETPGEDPATSSKYAVSYVRGLQGDSFAGGGSSGGGLKVSACCKHFTAYDMDNWNGNTRYKFDARVSQQDLEDTYQPPFKSCVTEARASGVMCSYNQVNGVPTCADYNLLSKTARGSWGFYGYITSDCDAVSIIHDAQGYAKTPEDAVADVLKAGMDVNCGTYVQKYGVSAIKQGKLSESDVNRALHNLFSVRMRLGLFDGNPQRLVYGNIPASQVCTKEHRDTALEAALDGIVLLKNSAGALPLSQSKVSSLGVIGPNANNLWRLQGNYAGPPCESVTPLKVLQSYVRDTRYVSGCDTAACGSSTTEEAVALARSVDRVVMFMGLDQTQEKEELDRVSLTLPGMQQSLITSVARAAKNPVVLVLVCGGPVDVTFAKDDRNIGAILWAGYPGEAGGLAMAQVLFGQHNPGGRLPVTWYPQEFTKVPMTDMRMRPDPKTGYPGRTYRFYTGTPVFKFGYGLSYSTYSYEFAAAPRSSLYLNKSVSLGAVVVESEEEEEEGRHTSYDLAGMEPRHCAELEFSATVRVRNRGAMGGRHPVLLFLRRPSARGGRPRTQLVGFESVHLAAEGEADVDFVLRPCEHLSLVSEDGRRLVDGGSHFLVVGDKEHEFNVVA